MEIDYYIDNLTPRKRLNRFHDNEIRKILYLRIDREFFLEYHPWEEFGDQNILSFLEETRRNEKLPKFLIKLLVLEQKRKMIPFYSFNNHDFGSNVSDFNGKYIKIKFDDNYPLIEKVLSQGNYVRIDFNNKFEFSEFEKWYNCLDLYQREFIDYLEDSGSNDFVLAQLKNLGLQLASDRNVYIPEYHQVKIIKPSIEDIKQSNTVNIYSSYMGGDLGRFHTYLALLQNGDLDLIHGIDTPGIYQEQLPLFKSNGLRREIDISMVEKMYIELEGKNWQRL